MVAVCQPCDWAPLTRTVSGEVGRLTRTPEQRLARNAEYRRLRAERRATGLAGGGTLGTVGEPRKIEPAQWAVCWSAPPTYTAHWTYHPSRASAEAAAARKHDKGIDAMVIDLAKAANGPRLATFSDSDIWRERGRTPPRDTTTATPADLAKLAARREAQRVKNNQCPGLTLRYNPFEGRYTAKLEFGGETHKVGDFQLKPDAIAAAFALRAQLLEDQVKT